jgi:hypothetical protein
VPFEVSELHILTGARTRCGCRSSVVAFQGDTNFYCCFVRMRYSLLHAVLYVKFLCARCGSSFHPTGPTSPPPPPNAILLTCTSGASRRTDRPRVPGLAVRDMCLVSRWIVACPHHLPSYRGWEFSGSIDYQPACRPEAELSFLVLWVVTFQMRWVAFGCVRPVLGRTCGGRRLCRNAIERHPTRPSRARETET